MWGVLQKHEYVLQIIKCNIVYPLIINSILFCHFSYKEKDELQTGKIRQICKRQQKRMSCKFLQNRQLITSVSTTYTRQQD